VGFAAAGVANQRDGLAGFGDEGDVGQHGPATLIFKVHLLKLDPAAEHGGRDAFHRVPIPLR